VLLVGFIEKKLYRMLLRQTRVGDEIRGSPTPNRVAGLITASPRKTQPAESSKTPYGLRKVWFC
jgi:hypothetical protein